MSERAVTVMREVPPFAMSDRAFTVMRYVTPLFTVSGSRIDAALLSTLLTNTPVGFAFFDADLRYQRVNVALAEINGVPVEEHLGRTVPEVLPHQSSEVMASLRRVLETQEPLVNIEVSGETPALPGTRRHWLVSYYPVCDQDGATALGVGAVVTEITERKRAAEETQRLLMELREETRTIETVNRIGQMLSAQLDVQKLVQAATDAATALTGAQFGAFFYNVTGETGEAYTLYSLSGVSQDAFAQFPMPRNTDVFGPTFRGEGVIRLDDVTQDARYGLNLPYQGMPDGHLPVRSYLAVPVNSRSGEVLGGLFFGHEKAGVFTERAERNVRALAAQAGIALDNARLFGQAQREIEERRRAEEALRESQRQTRTFLRDILYSVSEARLRLCDTPADLPRPLTPQGEPIPLSAKNLRDLRQRTVDVAIANDLPADRWQDLVTAVGEASMNAVVHGGGGGEGRIYAGESGTVQVFIQDQGKGIAMDRLHRATLERGYTTAGTMGHGFWMMLKTCDRIYLLTGAHGTTIVLEQDRTPPEPAWLQAR